MDERAASFEAFVRVHARDLFRTAFALTGSRSSADDLVQETLTRLYPKWDRVQAADEPVAYVRRALANRYVSERRVLSFHETPLWDVPDLRPVDDPASQVVDHLLVWELLGRLSRRQRAAIAMRCLFGCTDEEIAESLECRPATVRSLISKGLRSMRHDYATVRQPQEYAQ